MNGPTTDREEIRAWARSCQATPVQLRTLTFDSEPAQIRFVFGELGEMAKEQLQVISWEQFFAMFETMGLALVYDHGRSYEILQTNKQPRIIGMGAD